VQKGPAKKLETSRIRILSIGWMLEAACMK